MRNNLLFLMLIVSSTSSFAQSPKFDWVTQEGNASDERGWKISKASNGDIYVAITFNGSTNVGGTTYNQLGSNNTNDILFCKYNNNGSFVWAKHMYCSDAMLSPEMAIDGSDNLYVCVQYEGTLNFGGTPSTVSGSQSPSGTFAAKINPNGNILWAKTVAIRYNALTPVNLSVKSNGEVTFIGYTRDSVIINNTKYTSGVSGQNRFTYHLSYLTNGNYNWHWIGEVGTTLNVLVLYKSLRYDASGIYLYGAGLYTGSHTFNNGTTITSNGANDIFLVKFMLIGGSADCVWAKSFGSATDDRVEGMEIDQSGNLLLLSSLSANTNIDGINVSAPSPKTVLAKFNSSGICQSVNTIISSQTFAPFNGKELRRDISGNIYSSGSFNNNLVINSDTLTPNGASDALVFKIDGASYLPVWSKQFGGSGDDDVTAVATNDNELYCTGRFSGVTSFGSFTKTVSGNYDPFVAKLSGCDIPTVTVTYNGNTTLCNGQSLTLNANNIPNASFQWLKDNMILPNETGNSLVASGSGTYSLDINLGGVCRDTFGSVTVSVNNINASIQSAQPSICPNGTLQLYTNIPFSNYSWSTGVSTPTITINQQGNYAVTVTDGAGCLDTAYVTVGEFTPPQVPTILEGANCQLASSVIQNGYSYKWRLNGNVVGGNFAYLDASLHGSGFYTLEITDGNGCKSNTASPLSIICTVGIHEVLQTSFNVYPNPNNGTFNIFAQLSESKSATLKIFNLKGQVEFEKMLQPANNSINEEINLQSIPFGIYQLQFTVDSLQIEKKLIVQ